MWKVDYIIFPLLFAFFAVPGNAKPKVPAIFVFGDSLVDVGNNNYLTGNAWKANFFPYGVDFPHGRQTGRFSNGYIGIDFMAIHMGFKESPPPYLSLVNKNKHQTTKGLKGVNFASAGSGLLDSTGINMSISTTKQIQYFTEFRSHLATKMGTESITNLLSKSIFIICSGSNDIIALSTEYNLTRNTEKEQLIGTLISKYSEHLKALHNNGARKFMVLNMGPIGCCPKARTLNPLEECIDILNDLSLEFNKAFKVLMTNLSSTLQGLKYSILDSYAFMSTINSNTNNHGHRKVKNACCGSGKLNAQVLCNKNTSYCADRKNYLFWDMLHPTQETSKKYVIAMFDSHLKFANPISVTQLIEA